MAKALLADVSHQPDVKEIRQEYDDFVTQWQDIRDEGRTDMRHIAGDPWDKTDRDRREKANRHCLTFDELSQYINQLINRIRQNKRAVKLAPKDNAATDKTAEFRQNLIRQIEYESNAQSQAYIPMFENAVQRSYGYLRIKSEYAHHRSADQVLRIVGVPNPDMVTPDPYALSNVGEDWKRLYFGELWRVDDFRARWPKAKIRDFGAEAQKAAPAFVKGNRILVCERWRVTTRPRTLVRVQPPQPLVPPGQPPAPPAPPLHLFRDEVKEKAPKGSKIVKDVRDVDYPVVTQQFTNGLEILEEHPFPGTSIPFVSCYGKVLFVDEGSGAEKQMLSLIRLARDPFMAYCWLRTLELENIGLATRFPYFYYEGQLSQAQEDLLAQSNHEPVAGIKVKPMIDGLPPGSGPLPFPQRNLDEPQVQALEMAADSIRRAIQSAIGSSPLPTEAQRINDKSGVALQHIDDTEEIGSFHFIDHYENALTRTGQLLDELIPAYYDTARTVTARKPDDSTYRVRINDSTHPQSHNAVDGSHDAILSVGPAYQSAREAASEFADTIIGSTEVLQIIGPEKAAALIAQAIKLKDVGPIGDEMAEIINPPPPEQGGPISPQMVQQLQGQVKALTQQLQQAGIEIQTGLAKEKVRAAGQQTVAQVKGSFALRQIEMNNAAKIAIARITAAKAALDAMMEAEEERLATGIEQAHEANQNDLDRAHEAAMAAQDHAHTMEQGQAAHAQALEQGAQPPPIPPGGGAGTQPGGPQPQGQP